MEIKLQGYQLYLLLRIENNRRGPVVRPCTAGGTPMYRGRYAHVPRARFVFLGFIPIMVK